MARAMGRKPPIELIVPFSDSMPAPIAGSAGRDPAPLPTAIAVLVEEEGEEGAVGVLGSESVREGKERV